VNVRVYPEPQERAALASFLTVKNNKIIAIKLNKNRVKILLII